MGRRLRTRVPQIREWFMPGWPYLKEFKAKNKTFKEKQKENYDRSHRVKPRTDMEDGTPAWVSNPSGERSQGHVIAPANTPRSYVVETPTGEVRRNRSHIVPQVPMPSTENQIPKETDNEAGSSSSDQAGHSRNQIPRARSPIATRLRTGTKILPPERYTEMPNRGSCDMNYFYS